MPSHRVHRLCGALVGLPEDVVAFVDELIDSGECGAHDVGLEPPTVRLSEHLDISAALEHGARRLLECLQRLGRLDEAHLQAAALYLLLDSADRRMESLGTWAAEADAERFLRECVDWVEDRLRRQALSYFFGEGLGEAYTLVGYMRLLLEKRKAALAQCLEHIVLERRRKGTPPLGPGTLARLLTELCRRRGAKCLFRVGKLGKPLPAAPAAAKAFSMLKRGEAVAIESVDGKVAVAASSLKELVEKLLRG
ncbi:MAG: hypothetical protein LM576_03820 [Thermofilum sp.]|nr:hypothetical protein [Thermofilum sp.]